MSTIYLDLEEEITAVSDLVDNLVQDREIGLVNFTEYEPVIAMLMDLGQKILEKYCLFNKRKISRETMTKIYTENFDIISGFTLGDYVSEKISEHLLDILDLISSTISDEEPSIDQSLLKMLYTTWCDSQEKIKKNKNCF